MRGRALPSVCTRQGGQLPYPTDPGALVFARFKQRLFIVYYYPNTDQMIALSFAIMLISLASTASPGQMTFNTAASNPHATTNLIIVMGVSGSGKTTLAKALADLYGYEFLDGDDFHSDEARALMAEGVPLTDDHRAPWVAAIKQHLQSNASREKHAVLAFSGLKHKHRDMLRTAGLRTLVIHLTGEMDTIAERISRRKGHFMAPALLASQFDALESPQNEADVATLDVGTDFAQVLMQARRLVDDILLEKATHP